MAFISASIRRSYLVLWFTAAATIFLFLSQSHIRVNETEDVGEIVEDGKKTVKFKMEHCDCIR